MEISKKKDNKNNENLDIVSNSRRRYSFEGIGSFNYLRVKITSNGENNKSKKAYSNKVEERIYAIVIKPTVIYGCEANEYKLERNTGDMINKTLESDV